MTWVAKKHARHGAYLSSDKRKSVAHLRLIMQDLRHPETGCPWDKAQDFSSIAPYTVEESLEVAQAIAQKDMVALKYELGDVLLQVIYHSQLAAELGAFDFDDVVEAICDKMIHRHPHVFDSPNTDAISKCDDVQARWAELKKREKQALEKEKQAFMARQADNMALQRYLDHPKGLLDIISNALPSLEQAQKLSAKAAEVGFDWPSLRQVYEKLEEELEEFKQALKDGNQHNQKEELGDILFSTANLARHLGLDASEVLQSTNHKFRRRFAHVEKRCQAENITFNDAGLAQLDLFWNEARAADKHVVQQG